MLRNAFAVFAVALVLAGCQTSKIDLYVQQQLPAVCANAQAYQPVAQALIDAGYLKGSSARAVNSAFSALEIPCANPSEQTAASVLTSAILAFSTISKNVNSAKAAQQAAGG